MGKAENAAKYGLAGATAGSVGGPLTSAALGVGGAIYGWLSDTSDEQAGAEKQKLAGMQKAADVYQGYRPQAMGARQQGLGQKLSAYNGAGNAMGLMYGNSYNPANYAPDLGKLPNPSSYSPPPAAAAPAPFKAEQGDLQFIAGFTARHYRPPTQAEIEAYRGTVAHVKEDPAELQQQATFAANNGRPMSAQELATYRASHSPVATGKEI